MHALDIKFGDGAGCKDAFKVQTSYMLFTKKWDVCARSVLIGADAIQ
jgi:hypothetical protein